MLGTHETLSLLAHPVGTYEVRFRPKVLNAIRLTSPHGSALGVYMRQLSLLSTENRDFQYKAH